MVVDVQMWIMWITFGINPEDFIFPESKNLEYSTFFGENVNKLLQSYVNIIYPHVEDCGIVNKYVDNVDKSKKP